MSTGAIKLWHVLRRGALGSTRRKLILGVALVHAMMMTLFVWDLTSRERESLLAQQGEHAKALAGSVATSAAGWIVARDLTGLQEIVNAQRRYPELRYAMALDHNGMILAHTESARRGQYLRDLPQRGELTLLSLTPALADAVSPAIDWSLT